MEINRVWAMPNKNTFSIKPIADLIRKHIPADAYSIDPFANTSKIASVTNDLCPDYDTDYHIDAVGFEHFQKL
jgi:hypothetical protein